jgi:hypothetical protein
VAASRDPERRLILIRHAKSDWGDPTRADHDRPLNRRGRRGISGNSHSQRPLVAYQNPLAQSGRIWLFWKILRA